MYQCSLQKQNNDIRTNDDLIRLCAYDLLARIEINALPVIPDRLFDMDSIHCNTLQRLADHEGIPLEHLISLGEAGFIYREQNGKDYIYVNSDGSALQILWNMALGLGALELCIVPYHTCFPIPQNNGTVADFAYYFLAPDVVLEEIGICTQEKIFQYCRLPFRESVKKAVKTKHHTGNRRKMGVEKIILSNFRDFISKSKKAVEEMRHGR